jgi:hypothetical protein
VSRSEPAIPTRRIRPARLSGDPLQIRAQTVDCLALVFQPARGIPGQPVTQLFEDGALKAVGVLDSIRQGPERAPASWTPASAWAAGPLWRCISSLQHW